MIAFAAAVWLGIFLLLGFIGAPMGRRFLPEASDGGSGLGRVLALALWMYIYWLIPSITPIHASNGWAVVSLGIVAGLSLKVGGMERRFFQSGGKESALFAGLFFVFLLLRSFGSEIWGTDPLMDFMFLDSGRSAVSFPPPDRWFSGHSVNYYYLGQMLYVPAAKLAAAPTEVAISFGMATVLPMLAGVLYSFFGPALKNGRAVAAAVTGAVFLGTLAVPYKFLFGPDRFTWRQTANLFPRVILEFPLFSFFVGSFHAYFITLPVTAAAAVALVRWGALSGRAQMVCAASAGALVGLHDGLHTWAVPPLILLSGVVIVTGLWKRNLPWPSVLVFVVTALAVDLPFLWQVVKPKPRPVWIPREMRSDVFLFLLHWGAMLIPFLVVASRHNLKRSAKWRAVVIAVSAVAALGLGVTPALLLWLLMGAFLYRVEENPPERGATRALILTGAILLLLCEFIGARDPALEFQHPRVNTVFKFHYAAWAFLLLSAPSLWKDLGRRQKAIALAAWGLSLLFLPSALTTGSRAYATLDGLWWVRAARLDDANAIAWLRMRSRADAVVVEAITPDTPNTSLLSTFSSRPTVAAMTNLMMQQRSHQIPEILQRSADVREIYTTPDSARFTDLLQKYGVKYVAYGDRERSLYGEISVPLSRLSEVFRSGTLRIYDTGIR